MTREAWRKDPPQPQTPSPLTARTLRFFPFKRQFKVGSLILKYSIRVLWNDPALILPILTTWFVFAGTLLYFKYMFPWENYSHVQNFFMAYLVFFLWSFILSLSCLVLVECIRQQQMGKRPGLLRSLRRVLCHDLARALPVILIWSLAWFILAVVEEIVSRTGKGGETFTPEDAAMTLAGYEETSFLKGIFYIAQKAIRLAVFLILGAIVLENMGPMKSFKKAAAALKVHLGEFAVGFILTELAACIIFLPAAIIFMLKRWTHVEFPDGVWYVVIAYAGIAWSFSVYLEQMFMAGLYQWHLNWEKALDENRKLGLKPISLYRTPQPLMFRQVFDYKQLKQKSW